MIIKEAVRHILAFLKKWFWIKPTSKPEPLMAKDVLSNYTCLKYKGQWINLKTHEIPMFNAMARQDKRAMMLKFKTMQLKGQIVFREVNGKMTCIKNKHYESKAYT